MLRIDWLRRVRFVLVLRGLVSVLRVRIRKYFLIGDLPANNRGTTADSVKSEKAQPERNIVPE